MKVLDFLLARLGETSTWLAIAIAATAVAHALQSNASLGAALLAGLTAALLPEKK